jgi:hypothetical protein
LHEYAKNPPVQQAARNQRPYYHTSKDKLKRKKKQQRNKQNYRCILYRTVRTAVEETKFPPEAALIMGSLLPESMPINSAAGC